MAIGRGVSDPPANFDLVDERRRITNPWLQWMVGRSRVRTFAYDPGSIASGATETETFAFPGARRGDIATATFNQVAAGIGVAMAQADTDAVHVTFRNETGGSVNLDAGTVYIRVEPTGVPVPPTLFHPSVLSWALWLDADDLGLANGAAVTSWSDASGNGNTATPLAGTPTYRSAGLIGAPCVEFRGASQALGLGTTGFPTGGNGRTWVALVAPVNLTSRGFMLSYGTNANYQMADFEMNGWSGALNGHALLHTWDSGRMTQGVVLANNTPALLAITHLTGADITALSIRVNGASVATDVAAGVSNPTGGLATTGGNGRIGKRVDGSGDPQFDLRQLGLSTSALSTADIEKVEGWMAHGAGLASLLPLSHPYKGAPP